LVYFLYSLLLAAGMLVSLPYWVFQMLRHGKYSKGLGERLGRVPARLLEDTNTARISQPSQAAGVLWLHAVSVGEVLAVSRLIEECAGPSRSTG